MSKQILSNVANESLDQLQVAREYMAWVDSLTWAINSSLKSGHDNHAKQLAGVVSYLAGDYHNILDCEIQRLGDQLAAADLRA
ncbi:MULTISPECIES: hypothetical protein [Pseudomonas]|uniref:hypothetical protein n=1 Tax=Pseudomonas TaxID=286 RepID=UPI0003C7CADE|nr:hypothetical protein [Pseudomonas sp. MF6396]AIN60184.1 hypothetical protein O165_018475 [Pseudomonas soli]OOW01349.1 hypothetical protein MF6396_15985 [Pseudomonas sp. MF6396]